MIPLTVSGLLLANHLVQLNHKAVHSLKVSFLKSMLHFRFELLHSSFEPEPWGISWSASAACHGTSHQLHHGNVHLTQKRSSSKRRITVRSRMERPNTDRASPKDQIAEVAVQLYPIRFQKECSTMRQCSSFTRQLQRPWNHPDKNMERTEVYADVFKHLQRFKPYGCKSNYKVRNKVRDHTSVPHL